MNQLQSPSQVNTLNTQNSLIRSNERRNEVLTLENEIPFLKNRENSESEQRIESPSKTLLLPLLKKFIYILKKGTGFYKFRSLTKDAFTLINDPTYFSQTHTRYPKRRGPCQKFRKALNKLIQKTAGLELSVFHPYNNLKVLWDMVHFVFILILMFLIPVEVCFEQRISPDFRIVTSVFFLCDILMNMNTSYFDKGFIVKERRRIIQHYLETEFFVDLVTVVFYLMDLNEGESYWWLEMLFYLRWRKTEKIRAKLQEKFKIGLNIHTSLIELVNLLFFSFYILNIFACVWYYIGNNSELPTTWLSQRNLRDESFFVRYAYSLYWSTVTIMTVGYGDITSQNVNEVIFTTLTIFFGCGLFAYFINSIGGIVKSINKEARIFREKMAIINKYMERKNVDYNLQMKIREYLRFIWQEESTQNVETETEIISKLSKSLRSELIYESYGQVLKKSPLFFANFSEKFLGELMYEFREVRNIPEDSIFKQNQPDECEIYFIVRGKVEIYHTISDDGNAQGNVIQRLKEGESFGEVAFFTGHARTCYAKTTDFTTLFLIRREDFLRLLSRNPEDYEKYCMIRDQVVLESKMNFLQTKCFACGSKDHVSLSCPLIHYIPNRVRVVLEHARDPGQRKRRPINRYRTEKFHALYFQKSTEAAQQKFKLFSVWDPEDENESLEDIPQDENFGSNVVEPGTITNTGIIESNDSIKPTQDEMLEIDTLSQNFLKPPSSPKFLEHVDLFSARAMIEENQSEESKSDKSDFIPLPLKLEKFLGTAKPFTEDTNMSPTLGFGKRTSIDLTIEKNAASRGFKKSQTQAEMNKSVSPSLRKQKGCILSQERKKLTFEETAPPISMNSNGMLPFIQTQYSILKRKNEKEISEKIDLFDKEFEKGANLKNFFPEANLSNFLLFQRKVALSIRRQRKKNEVNKKWRNSPTAGKKSLKNNKVIPENFEEKESPSRFGVQKEKDNRQHSNIFTIKRETAFFAHNKQYTFYDIVYEVLHNAELRRKLQEMRSQSLKRKKSRFFD